MDWPPALPENLEADGVSLSTYLPQDAEGLFEALDDERAWEHIPYPIPTSPSDLDEAIARRLSDGNRLTFTIRQAGKIVGTTSIIRDPMAADGVEIGATQHSPDVWGTGVNSVAKALLISALFDAGAAWIQFRTDERNHRLAAAIRKLGAEDLGIREDTIVRRDGSVRRSHFFRLSRDV